MIQPKVRPSRIVVNSMLRFSTEYMKTVVGQLKNQIGTSGSGLLPS